MSFGGVLKSELEEALRDLLILGQSSHIVADRIADRLLVQATSRRERQAFFNFLIQTGHHRSAIKLLPTWFTAKEQVPWRYFLYLLHDSGYKPDAEFLDHFFRAMDEVDQKDRIEVFSAWAKYDQRFVHIEAEFRQRLQSESAERQQRLFEKLEYFRSHRMIEEEEKVLHDLIERFPDREGLKQDLENLRTRWAHHFISEKARATSDSNLMQKADAIAPEDWQFADHLVTVMKDVIKKIPLAAYDFAIGLYFMDFYHHALEILKSSMPNLAVDWFRLELLLKARQFLECLEEIGKVEAKYSDDPESSFASTYIRAQVLRGLGQTGSAVELMRSIVNIRPSYRSAHSLLLEWGGTV